MPASMANGDSTRLTKPEVREHSELVARVARVVVAGAVVLMMLGYHSGAGTGQTSAPPIRQRFAPRAGDGAAAVALDPAAAYVQRTAVVWDAGICDARGEHPEMQPARCLTIWDAGFPKAGIGSIFQNVYGVFASARRFGVPFCYRSDQCKR